MNDNEFHMYLTYFSVTLLLSWLMTKEQESNHTRQSSVRARAAILSFDDGSLTCLRRGRFVMPVGHICRQRVRQSAPQPA